MVYCYGANQLTAFTRMQNEQGIHFYEGILDSAMLDKWYKKSNGGLLVLEDHMDEGSGDQRVLDLFTRDSHHRRITVIYMNQDMFPKGKFLRPYLEMHIISSRSKTLEINWECVFSHNKLFRKNLKTC